jgi:two-component system, OmpR family, phosphate regulon sensor histidine kinase PhoR
VKNKGVILITVLFSLMLIGIVVIQAWWVSRSEKLNQLAFDAAVYRSLEGVVKQVEEKENFSFINREISGDTIIRSAKNLKVIKNPSNPKKPLRASVSNSIKISVNHDSGNRVKTIVRVEKSADGEKTVENSIIINDEKLELPTPPPVPETPVIPEEKIEDIEVLVKKMSHIKDPGLITVKPDEIKKIITEQLKQNNLPSDFSFCLLSKDPKKSFVQRDGELGIPYKINLYPNDLFGRDVTLVVFFSPANYKTGNKDWYWPEPLSFFFTLSLLLLFAYSIRMLLLHKKMLAQKNDFINHMSHEFKTPLAGISLGADMLIDKPEKLTDEQIHRIATIIKKQSERLDKEVTGVLLSAQLDENINNNRAPFNLVETLKTQIDLFSLQLENKGAIITTHFVEPVIPINGDESLWQKVFSNLLDNSLKFSEENPEIDVSVSKTNNSIKITFTDNGIGIAEKDLPHVFEKFYRSNYYKQSNIQGFGLGLNFVKKVVDSHKGTIKAESELGKGTKITVEINA